MLPVLRVAARGEISIGKCIDIIADELKLTDNERTELLPSGKQSIFSNRVHWAKTYLVKSGVLNITRRGYVAATVRGQDILHGNPLRLDNSFLERYPEFLAFRSRSIPRKEESHSNKPIEVARVVDKATPEERIETTYEEITSELRADLLDKMIAAKPEFFENLIVDLMIAMGYGGSRREAGQRLGRSGDGGIDGLINEDILGLDSIYLQAKRYAIGNAISVDKVREFAGALVERGANKGVFVTTSYFASGAKSFSERIPQKLVLIDGGELTRLMFQYNVGVRVTRILELKKIDLDYFEDSDET